MLTDGSSYCGQISDQWETSAVFKRFGYSFRITDRRCTFNGRSFFPRTKMLQNFEVSHTGMLAYLRMTSASLMKLMIFISLPHLGQTSGFTSQTLLKHSRH
jgi:hypothetical protein